MVFSAVTPTFEVNLQTSVAATHSTDKKTTSCHRITLVCHHYLHHQKHTIPHAPPAPPLPLLSSLPLLPPPPRPRQPPPPQKQQALHQSFSTVSSNLINCTLLK